MKITSARKQECIIADLLEVLKELPDLIKDLDGGNPETSTGWASEEMLDLWMRVRAAITKAEGVS